MQGFEGSICTLKYNRQRYLPTYGRDTCRYKQLDILSEEDQIVECSGQNKH
jgi:hypothetical protein